MRFTGFIGPSYTLQSVNADCQRTVNLYPEINELGTGKEREVATLRGTPGKRLLLTLAGGATRGGWTASNGQLFAVGGNKFYRISSAWVATELGSLNTSEGPVSIADNGTIVMIVDGDNGYTWNIETSTFAEITDEDFPGANQVTFQDGYFIYNDPDSGRFGITGLNDATFDALDFATAEGSPDDLVGHISDHQNLYLLGEKSTEVWYNSGDADFPFVRNQGALIEIGCAARFSIGKIGGSIFWLGQDDNGHGTVYQTQGFQPKRISTHAVEKSIASVDDVSSARAWTYQQGGHQFYCLNLDGATSTWAYDVTTGLWHERVYLNLGEYDRDRADWHCYAHGENVVGDYENGKIYALDPDYYSDAGNEIPRERTAPHISKQGKRVFHHEFRLDMETGVGIDGSGQGTDPQAMLQWSDDGGHTWSNERWADIGAIGNRSRGPIWRRLGSARDRVYRVKITDPVKVVLLGAEVELEEGVA